MKKFLPLIIFIVGLLALLLVYFLVIKKGPEKEVVDEKSDSLIEVALTERPVTSLTPTSDGHWLNLKIDKIGLPAQTLDYELLYSLPDGRTQGVPGTITLNNQSTIERKLLLGSESSGKFRYDEGVKEGTLTLRFRNDKGKMIARFTTKFALLSNTKELSSIDSNFKVSLNKIPKGFFVIMETFGVGSNPPGEVKSGPYGLYSSADTPLLGTAIIEGYTVYHLNGTTWSTDSFGAGQFIGLSQ